MNPDHGERLDVRPPVRVTHTYTQTLDGTVAQVLPLLCPVREAEWVPGWAPHVIFTASGVVEPDCVFTTHDPDAGPDAVAIWSVLSRDKAAGTVEMLKVTPGFLVVRVSIALRRRGTGGCFADVTYRYTAIGPAGEAYVRRRTAEAYAGFMRRWEDALNTYLRGPREQRG